MRTVIVTDGKYRSSIAAVRALGRSGWNVVVTQTDAECPQDPPVFFSKYASHTHRISGSCKDPDYANKLLQVVRQYQHPVLLCIGADTLNMISSHAEQFSACADFLISSPAVLDALNDKEVVHTRAVELGLPVPKQYDHEPEDFPVVIKPHCGEKFGLKAADRYLIAEHAADFRAKYEKMQRYDPEPIVQQKVEGDGMGACLLLDRDGRLIEAVCHRRIREYPITGGPSSCCVSFFDEAMISAAYELLHSFGFTGMAMVEFKGPYILEVNPRVWGSYPMTVCCGSAYTERYALAAAGETLTYAPNTYNNGVKMRFLLNDAMSTLSHFKKGHFKEGFGGLLDMLRAKEALRDRDDPKPFRKYLRSAMKRL